MVEAMILRGGAADLWAEFPRVSVTVVVGPTGSGKSTLLGAIADSRSVSSRSGEINCGRAWLLPQPTRERPPADPRLVALARVHLDLWLDVHPGVLSAALHDALFASEAAIFRASQILAANADMLLLDEPDALLDPLAGFALAAMLRARAREGSTVVLSTRNFALVARVADHVLFTWGT